MKAGAGWGRNTYGTTVEAGLISESFDLDLDGPGPVPGISLEVQVEPVIDIAVSTTIWNFSSSMATGVTLLICLACIWRRGKLHHGDDRDHH